MMEGIYGLIGGKLGHSYSAPIHGFLGNREYRLIELEPREVPAFFARGNIAGLNVTIPYKREAMRYCDKISPEAEDIGAVNTIVNRGGRLTGYNTDKYGFEWMARRAGIEFSGKKTVIFGSGGASLTAQAAARALGAVEIVTISRSGPDNYGNIGRHADAEIIINTTPVGMYPKNLCAPVSLADFPKCSGVIDVVYNPRRTALLMEAERLGIPFTGGLSMLVAQAKAAEELFFGARIPDEVIPEITGRLRRDMENIVLIGMPGSGKSAIGKELARLTQREAVDTDEMTEAAAGKSIPAIFGSEGEPAFRKMEREAILSAGKECGRIIMTGGGAVLNPQNYAPLHQNGRIYHVSRDGSLLETEGRPLSRDPEALRRMSGERLPLYERFRDAEIKNDGSVSEAAEKIWGDFLENTGG
ncbi:MAG: shikimate kinase [Clostridia bacterium]|nr:shikimate kinase [Clostridia bacterium]